MKKSTSLFLVIIMIIAVVLILKQVFFSKDNFRQAIDEAKERIKDQDYAVSTMREDTINQTRFFTTIAQQKKGEYKIYCYYN